MASTRPTIRTLPGSGEKITHYPDGKTVLHPSTAGVDLLAKTEKRLQEAALAADQKLLAAISEKQAAMDAGEPVPYDKRVV